MTECKQEPFVIEEWRYREFVVENVLKVEQTNSVIAKANLIDGDIPYVTRTTVNNGYTTTCGNADKINKGNCITIGAETGVAFYQPNDFVAGNKVYKLSHEGLAEEEYLFLVTALNMHTKNYSYSNARIPAKIRKESISLPILLSSTNQPIIDETHRYHKDGFIPDWKYMQERIKELEQERIKELEQYLIVTGLNDYELTEEDKELLATNLFDGDKESHVGKEWKEAREFRVGVLFEKPKLGWKADRKFNKRNDLSTIPTPEFSLPLVNAKYGNNGIMYYGREDDFYSIENSIDIVNDGAVSAGSVYPQPDKTGVLYNAYLITLKDHTPSRKEIEYLATCLNKVIKPQFSYSNKAGWDKVQKTNVSLPIQTDSSNHPVIDPTRKYHPEGFVPDWDYMEKYIRAMEKVVIRDVVVWKDEMIEKTKMVVNG